MNFLRTLWYNNRIKAAQNDLEYFKEEVHRCASNVEVARQRIRYLQKKQMEAKYPVRGMAR